MGGVMYSLPACISGMEFFPHFLACVFSGHTFWEDRRNTFPRLMNYLWQYMSRVAL